MNTYWIFPTPCGHDPFDLKAETLDLAIAAATDRLGHPPHQVLRRPWDDEEEE